MAFRAANPHTSDFIAPIADFILDNIPGARDLDTAVHDADAALLAARRTACIARQKLRDMSDHSGEPLPSVKRADHNKADDAARAATAAADAAERAYDAATRRRWHFVHDTMDEPAFVEKVGPMYAAASQHAREALDALSLALSQRDTFASALGRVIDVEGGNYGVREALRQISAFVDAGLVDENAAAWSIVTDAIGAALLMAGDRARILTECVAVRDDESIPAHDKADEYRAILDRHGLLQRKVIR